MCHQPASKHQAGNQEREPDHKADCTVAKQPKNVGVQLPFAIREVIVYGIRKCVRGFALRFGQREVHDEAQAPASPRLAAGLYQVLLGAFVQILLSKWCRVESVEYLANRMQPNLNEGLIPLTSITGCRRFFSQADLTPTRTSRAVNNQHNTPVVRGSRCGLDPATICSLIVRRRTIRYNHYTASTARCSRSRTSAATAASPALPVRSRLFAGSTAAIST